MDIHSTDTLLGIANQRIPVAIHNNVTLLIVSKCLSLHLSNIVPP